MGTLEFVTYGALSIVILLYDVLATFATLDYVTMMPEINNENYAMLTLHI